MCVTSSPTDSLTGYVLTPIGPGDVIKLGKRVPSGVGVGPEGDIVGFTTICPHKGFPLAYNKDDLTLNCPGHYSRFDCEKGGQQIWGQATQNLPQYVLRINSGGDIYADGVDELLGHCPTSFEGGSDGLQTSDRPPSNRPQGRERINVVCHYNIVGCGYKAYTWPVNKQGGTAPDQNKFGVDLSKQQDAETAAWYSPSMYNIVRQNGEDVHLVLKPDPNCVVNSGLGSVRGARMAEMSYSRQRNTQLQRLTNPMVWRYGQMQPTSWDDALDLVARDHCRGDQRPGRRWTIRICL